MSIPISQMWKVSKYVIQQRMSNNKQYPLVLMLEPLFRCNLQCTGCGKIQFPVEVLRKNLSVSQCLEAANECNTPVVSIAGGEPLLHPEIAEIVEGLVQQKRYVYLCTNALLLEEKIKLFKPSVYLSFSVHLDGLETEHDQSVSRPGTYAIAVNAIKTAVAKEFRVTTNTTFYNNADPQRARQFFDTAMGLGIEAMMISAGYHYTKAKSQEVFLARQQTIQLFRKILYDPKRTWVFNHSPLYLEFLAGAHEDYDCTPWGTATYNIFGWQSPCYLLEKSYQPSFAALLHETDWSKYGRASQNPECADCMMHCGYEPTAVQYTFTSGSGLLDTAVATLHRPKIPKPEEK